jgi:hypothetical protein
VATGIQLDLTLMFIGMVLPFWAVIGGFIGLIITVALPIPSYYTTGVLIDGTRACALSTRFLPTISTFT